MRAAARLDQGRGPGHTFREPVHVDVVVFELVEDGLQLGDGIGVRDSASRVTPSTVLRISPSATVVIEFRASGDVGRRSDQLAVRDRA